MGGGGGWGGKHLKNLMHSNDHKKAREGAGEHPSIPL